MASLWLTCTRSFCHSAIVSMFGLQLWLKSEKKLTSSVQKGTKKKQRGVLWSLRDYHTFFGNWSMLWTTMWHFLQELLQQNSTAHHLHGDFIVHHPQFLLFLPAINSLLEVSLIVPIFFCIILLYWALHNFDYGLWCFRVVMVSGWEVPQRCVLCIWWSHWR